jgi:chromosome segregation protein
MRLRKIETRGFKSFVDRTVLHVGHGLSAIVGPNGCGKSNIIDAIRWAMGEQNPRRLRGDRMADLIFAGSDTRAPTGLAEVKLVFDECDGQLGGLAKGSESAEICRRLYREGDSEYLLNRSEARLKDITNVFLDTGVGARACSIIEQGQVGWLVNARPQERRSIIEEAAGVTRYRSQRGEAQRKLDRTRQNLERVRDMVDELARQMRSLRRQAAKANRYRRFRLQLREAQVFEGLGKAVALRAELDEIRSFLSSAREQGEKAERSCRAEELAVQQLRSEVSDGNARIEHLKVEQAQTTARIQVLEQQQILKREESARLKQRGQSLASESDRLAEQRREAASRKAELDARTGAAHQQLEAAKLHLAELEAAEAAASEALRQVVARINEFLSRNAELRAEQARVQVEGENLQRLESELRQRLEVGEQEWAEIEQGVAANDSAAAAGRVLVGERKQRLADLSDQLEQTHGEYVGVGRDRAKVEIALRKAADEMSERRSRLRSLTELQQSYEQYGEGVRAVMEYKKHENGGSGILGTVIEFIEADADLEPAVEAALGGHLRSVVVDEPGASVRAVELLRERGKGRGTFVPVLGGGEGQGRALAPEAAGVLGRLRERVTVREGYEPLADRLLGDALLVESLQRGLELLDVADPGQRLVTVGGDVVEADGTVSGGTAANAHGGLLSKRRELRATEKQVARVAERHALLQRELEELNTRFEELGRRREELRSERHKAELELLTAQKDLAQLEELGREAVNRQAELTARKATRKDRLAELAQMSVQLQERTAELERQASEGDSGLGRLRQGQDEAEVALEQARQAVVDARVETARLRQADENLEREVREVERGLLQSEQRAARILAEINEASERANHLEQEASQAVDEARELDGVLSGLGEQLYAAQEALNATRDTLGERDGQLARAREELNASQRLQQEQSIREATCSSALRHALDGLVSVLPQSPAELLDALLEQDEIEVEILGARPTALADDGADGEGDGEGEGTDEEEQANPEASGEEDPSTREAVAQGPAGPAPPDEAPRMTLRLTELRDAEAVQSAGTRVEELTDKLARMGELNLAAPEDYQVAKERHDFLDGQRGDLERAMADLRATINRLNKITRTRFQETFDAVNAELGRLYPALVGGGAAQLNLTDPEDLLETGVELFVRPPGTRLQNVSLLSGGQKAMAAVALLLSVFRVNPSPFCLLDEVDAPLDDANVDRYLNILREMSDRTQFVIITHNKRAMEHCDALYGVTMEEPGVSKIVSVKLDSVGRRARSGVAAAVPA